ncbi:TPA: hypothetical protein ACKU3G_004045 [Bacillus cereus]
MILLELIQGEKRYTIGLFNSEECIKNFINKIPFVTKTSYKIDSENYTDYVLPYSQIPEYYEVNYKEFIFILSKFMFSRDEEIYISWDVIHNWDKKCNLNAKNILVEGFTKVDAYLIPNKMVKKYIEDREILALEIQKYYNSLGLKSKRCFLGSEDGEALVGIDKEGKYTKLIHLDPDTVEGMLNSDNLMNYLSEI